MWMAGHNDLRSRVSFQRSTLTPAPGKHECDAGQSFFGVIGFKHDANALKRRLANHQEHRWPFADALFCLRQVSRRGHPSDCSGTNSRLKLLQGWTLDFQATEGSNLDVMKFSSIRRAVFPFFATKPVPAKAAVDACSCTCCGESCCCEKCCCKGEDCGGCCCCRGNQ